jgi:site-specific DNA-methyltransferase (cytosine-N4-specific)
MAEATWASYRLFPYERALATREVATLTNEAASPTSDGFSFSDAVASSVIERATYFNLVRSMGFGTPTRQAAVEQRHTVLRGVEQRRQATRYGLHGIHEYKGKFNPQVVRALTNVVDPDAAVLFDPFCGSGTSLIEAVRLGIGAVGVDRSPMAVFLASAKAKSLAEPDYPALRADFAGLVRDLAAEMKEAQQSATGPTLDGILDPDAQSYLRSWFPPEALAAVSVALSTTVPAVPRTTVHHLAEVALSSILRSVSLQLPDDLRVRRRPEPFEPPPVWELFLEAAERIEAGLEEMEAWPRSGAVAQVYLGSACDPAWLAGADVAARRFILTSPPYATALPYIDTDRLSIVALGLASVKQVRQLEMDLVGSREWRKADERGWWRRLSANTDALPDAVMELVRDLQRRNEDDNAGFRRAAVPALLYRYFARMGECFDAWRAGLRTGERAVLIVGNNRTTAGGEQTVIRTPQMLGEVAATREFVVEEIIPLETWPRYGLHGKNGVSGEDALVIRRR